ncbi:cytochrome c oxidase subunit II [Thermasporomyces composti]|uniref:Cytochrome c oxidase subunit 2 n=1 Tax=Thermasporomyces composti TaxID=696763 RepID=A0A3D9V9S3_THECX|nr:cytochrome c oxidase subunit II [Thermasporomyces composti]REF34904.1 cytochrome c oxidase subunit 2 [Thermasporomyces composti]
MRSNPDDRMPRRARRWASVASLAGVALVSLSGCAGQGGGNWSRLGLPAPASDRATHVLNLWQGAWIAAACVGLLVWGLIIWSVIAYRRRDDKIPPQTRYHLPIEILYSVVPFVIIGVLFYFTVRDQNAILKVDRNDPPANVIRVVGQQWSWTFNYLDRPGRAAPEAGAVWESGTPDRLPTLYLPVGEKVGFQLESPDVIHSFFIPAFLFKMDVIPGHENYFELTPTKEGVFAGKCAELCGSYHARMLFNVHVVSREEFAEHLRELRARGQTGEAVGGARATTQHGLVSEAQGAAK